LGACQSTNAPSRSVETSRTNLSPFCGRAYRIEMALNGGWA